MSHQPDSPWANSALQGDARSFFPRWGGVLVPLASRRQGQGMAHPRTSWWYSGSNAVTRLADAGRFS